MANEMKENRMQFYYIAQAPVVVSGGVVKHHKKKVSIGSMLDACFPAILIVFISALNRNYRNPLGKHR